MDSSNSPIRVLLAIPESLIRSGLAGWLKESMATNVVGETSDGDQTLDVFKETSPDVMVLSPAIANPGLLQICRAIRASDIKCMPVLLVSDDTRDIALVAARAGVRGLMRIDVSAEEATDTIRNVHNGDLHYSKRAMQCIVEDYAMLAPLAPSAPAKVSSVRSRSPAPVAPTESNHTAKAQSLSKRELQVLVLVTSGKTSREIAENLGISVRTVEAHRARISDKIGIRTVAGLTRFALKTGLM